MNSFLERPRESRFLRLIQRVMSASNRRRRIPIMRRTMPGTLESGAYSAAAANGSFTFADDIMKSEMRGTISDLKREPLKTP
jgi:hypothetical protein